MEAYCRFLTLQKYGTELSGDISKFCLIYKRHNGYFMEGKQVRKEATIAKARNCEKVVVFDCEKETDVTRSFLTKEALKTTLEAAQEDAYTFKSREATFSTILLLENLTGKINLDFRIARFLKNTRPRVYKNRNKSSSNVLVSPEGSLQRQNTFIESMLLGEDVRVIDKIGACVSSKFFMELIINTYSDTLSDIFSEGEYENLIKFLRNTHSRDLPQIVMLNLLLTEAIWKS